MSAQSLIETASASGAQWHDTRTGVSTPSTYGDFQAEYNAIRNRTALHYSCHWGRLLFTGADHIDFLHRMTTNHFLDLEDGYGLQAVFTENRGRIIDLGTFYHRDQQTLAIVSPTAGLIIRDWLDRFLFTEEVEINDLSSATSAFELLGPDAYSIAEDRLGLSLGDALPNQSIAHPTSPDLWITILPPPWQGLRFIGPDNELAKYWHILMEKEVQPAGEDAWNTRRIELGYPLLDNELNKDHNPWEAGLGQAIHMNKGCYIGQEIIARLDTYDKIKQHLVGITCDTESTPKPGTVLQADGKPVGTLTSSIYSPTLGQIALAYVRRSHSAHGTVLTQAASSHCYRVQSLPFKAVC